MDIVLVLELLAFAVLMGFSGFFSSSETALFSLNKSQIAQMRQDDNPRISLIERLLSEPRRLIVTILIGNEFVNVAASVISAAIVIKFLGAESKLVNLLIMVPILLLVGEITPKTLAIRNNVAFATFQCRPIQLFAMAITPIRVVVRIIADFFTTLIVGRERARGSIVTEDMVRTLAREAVGEGVLETNEARFIDEIFNFGDKTLVDIQTPRSNIFFLPVSMPPTEMIANLRQTRYTKVPVYREHRDEIEGVLHSRDLLDLDLVGIDNEPERLLKRLRKPYLVPESKSASELFRTFRKRKLSMALTVDEYGGVTGLVTMEDLLESIFGDLPSASDVNEQVEFELLPDGSRQVDSTMTLEQFNEEFGVQLEGGDFKTVGGLILNACGELPAEGTSVKVRGVEFTVGEVQDNRIREVTVRRVKAGEANAERKTQQLRGSAHPSSAAEASADSKRVQAEPAADAPSGAESAKGDRVTSEATDAKPSGNMPEAPRKTPEENQPESKAGDPRSAGRNGEASS
jgi:CBS domain containing-hemolysin-like protein